MSDPNIDAIVHYIAERAGHDINESVTGTRLTTDHILKQCVDDCRSLPAMDRLIVASAIVYSAGRSIGIKDPGTRDKLLTLARQIDNIADSY